MDGAGGGRREHPAGGDGWLRQAWIEAVPERMPLGRLLAWTGQAVGEYYRRTVWRHGLSPTGLGVLGVLAVRDGVSHRDLAGRLGVSPATLTPLMDTLEAEGVVLRQRDPNDRRVVRLWITDAGRERLGGALDGVAAALAERIPTPSPAHERAIRDYLLAVLVAVDDRQRP